MRAVPLLLFLSLLPPASMARAGTPTPIDNACESLLRGKIAGTLTTSDAWAESVSALREINQRVYNRADVIEAMTTAILAREFVWMNGEPGGAKTFLSRIVFQAVLNTIPDQEKRIFVLQFHKLISEGKITGFQKFQSMMKDGKYEIETESSLVGDRYLFLIADEAEKSNPAVLNALLAVLNERKAFLGSRVVDAILASGVFTSNKTTGEFVQGFLNDRPSGEALLDRMAIKIHIPNQQLNPQASIAMYDLVKNPQKSKIELPLYELDSLVRQVKVDDSLMRKIVRITREFDRFVTQKADESRKTVRYGEADAEYFPANQFSNRSVRRMVQVFKSAFIAHQLSQGVPFDQLRLTPDARDLPLLSKSAVYIGAGEIQLKRYALTDENSRVQGTSPYGTKASFDATLSPYDHRLILTDQAGEPAMTFEIQKDGSFRPLDPTPAFTGWSVTDTELKTLNEKIAQVTEAQAIDENLPQFEVDSNLQQLLAKGTFKNRTKAELESIQADLNQLVTVLNQTLTTPESELAGTEIKPLTPQRTVLEQRAFRRDVKDLTPDQQAIRYYDWIRDEIKPLKERFVELDYSIEAHLTAMLSDNHLYVFGPPGGAKTALAETILKAELKTVNQTEVNTFVNETLTRLKNPDGQAFLAETLNRLREESPKEFDRFLLQFHKLLPEGVLIGFPKVEKQLNEGIEEIETSSSLAAERFIFAILDEVDKANPQTITALLSILNEREVFAGNRVIKVALRTAIMTSNKMPSEFLDSYYEDRSTGEAVMDRAVDKVYVSNKISNEADLTRFLTQLENGGAAPWNGLLGIQKLKPLMDQVEFSSPMVKELLATVHQKFLAARIKVEEESRSASRMDSREFPDYYVSAAGSASDRTLIKLLDQLKARKIVHQLMNDVPVSELKTSIEVPDIALFFEGLGYWAPQTISVRYADDGIVEFEAHSDVIQNLIQSGVVDARTKYHLEMMVDEAKDFVNAANSTVREFMSRFKDEIAKYPNLFPGAYQANP